MTNKSTTPVGHFSLSALGAAGKALAAHTERLGIEGDSATQLWHLVGSLSELCASQGLSLQDILTDVNEHVRRGDIILAGTHRQLLKQPVAAPSEKGVLSDDQVQLAATFFASGFSVTGERFCGEHYDYSQTQDSETLTDEFRAKLALYQKDQDITNGVHIEVEVDNLAQTHQLA
jgi:hypothetical protein